MNIKFNELYQKFRNGTITKKEEKKLFIISKVLSDLKEARRKQFFIISICFLLIVLTVVLAILICI